MMSQSTTEENRSTYAGYNWAIFNLCVIPGNLASHFLLQSKHKSGDGHGWDPTNSPLFVFLTASGLVGALLFLVLKKPDAEYGTPETLDERPVMQQIGATFSLLGTKKMILLVPIMAFTGIQMSFWASWLTVRGPAHARTRPRTPSHARAPPAHRPRTARAPPAHRPRTARAPPARRGRR